LRNEGAAAGNAESRVESGRIMFAIHKCLNLLGNYLSSQFESREMGDGVPFVKSRDLREIDVSV
jgi:hypothetical protein